MSNDSIQLRLHCAPLGPFSAPITLRLPIGFTVERMLARAGLLKEYREGLSVVLNGVTHGPQEYKLIQPRNGDILDVHIVPQLDSNGELSTETARLMGSVAIGLGGIFVPQALGASGVMEWALRAGITLLGLLAVDSLLPVLDDEETTIAPEFTGARNAFNAYSRVPKVYGKHRFSPPMAAQPYTEMRGGQVFIKALLCLGYRPIKVHDDTIEIGGLPLSEFNANYRIIDGFSPGRTVARSLHIYSNRDSVHEQVVEDLLVYNVFTPHNEWGTLIDGTLVHYDEVRVYMTNGGTTQISMDIAFLDGLLLEDSSPEDGTGFNHTVGLHVQYKLDNGNNDGAWTTILDNGRLSNYIQPVVNMNTTNMLVLLDQLSTVLDADITSMVALSASGYTLGAALLDGGYRFIADLEEAISDALTLGGLSAGEIAVLATLTGRLLAARLILDVGTPVQSVFGGDIVVETAFLSMIKSLPMLTNLLRVRNMIEDGLSPTTIVNTFEYQQYVEQQASDPFINGGPATYATVTSNSKDVVRVNFHTNVPEGRYRVRVRRATPPGVSNDDSEYIEDTHVTAFRSLTPNRPVAEHIFQRLAFMEIEVPVTDTANGGLNEISMVVETPLRTYDGADWSGYELGSTRNPAWVYVDMLTGEAGASPAPLDRIDATQVKAWADYCDTKGITFDRIIDNNNTLKQAVQNVCRVGMASPFVRDGLYSIAYDHTQLTPVQMITAQNSHSFSIVKSMQPLPHALRIKFINPRKGWVTDSINVYLDGYGPDGRQDDLITYATANSSAELVLSFPVLYVHRVYDNTDSTFIDIDTVTVVQGTTSTTITADTPFEVDDRNRYTVYTTVRTIAPSLIEEIDMRGIIDVPELTSHEFFSGNAERYGKYLLRVLVHRPEVFTVEMDIEAMVAVLGDLVTVRHDATLWGLGEARVLNYETNTAGDYTVFNLDARHDLPDANYDIKVRKSNGTIVGPWRVSVGPSTAENAFDLLQTVAEEASPAILYGDLILWGLPNEASIDCVIKQVKPRREGKVKLTLVEMAIPVFASLDEPIGQHDPNITIPERPELVKPRPPQIVRIVTDEGAMLRGSDGIWRVAIRLTLYMPPGRTSNESAAMANVDSIEIMKQPCTGNEPLAMALPWTGVGKFDSGLGQLSVLDVETLGCYNIRVRSITRDGIFSDWHYASEITVLGTSAPPPDILPITMTFINNVLDWAYAPPPDFAGFKVRAMGSGTASWNAMSSLHEGLITASKLTLPPFNLDEVTLGIKAVDTYGGESKVAAIRTFKPTNSEFGHILTTPIFFGPDNPDPRGGTDFWSNSVHDYSGITRFRMTEDGTTHFLEQDHDGSRVLEESLWYDLGMAAFNKVDLSFKAFQRRDKLCSFRIALTNMEETGYGSDFLTYASIMLSQTADKAPYVSLMQRNLKAPLWPEDSNDAIWTVNDGEEYFWPWQAVWHPYTGPIPMKQLENLWQVRIHIPNQDSDGSNTAIMESLKVVTHTPLKSITVEVDTGATGSAYFNQGVDFPDVFNEITSVVATLMTSVYAAVDFVTIPDYTTVTGRIQVKTWELLHDSSGENYQVAARGQVHLTITGF